ncbi:MAG: DUF2125 domain-containing protein [Defluviicoccus sp.]
MRAATRRLSIAAAGLAMLAGAYTGYWCILAGLLERGALAWIEGRQRHGDAITHGTPARRGFPGRVEIVLPAPALAVQAAAQTIAVAGERAVVSLDPFAPQWLTLSLEGEQTVVLSGSTRPRRFAGKAERFDLQVRLRLALLNWSVSVLPTPATFTVRALTMIDAHAGDRVAVAALDATADALPEGALGRRYALAVEDAKPPASLDLPFAGVVSRAAVDLDVSGSLPAVPTSDDIRAWRDAGGVVEVRRLELASGPVRLWGDGTLALDGNGQPIGALTVEISGYHSALDALIVHGSLNVITATRLKQLFAVLAGGSINSAKPVRIPLTLQDQVLAAGPIPLMQVPLVVW